MEFNKKKTPSDWRDMLLRTIIIVASVVVIISALPRDDSQTYRYNVGKPWMYGSFIAKFDFPVYKTDEVLQRERDSVLKAFQPYYTLKSEVETQQIEKLEKDYPDGFPDLPQEYLRIITNRLHRLYQARIMDTAEYNQIAVDSTAMVRIVSGKEADSQNIGYIYSTRNAYEQLFIDDELGEMRSALQKCNLNEYIEPNIIYDKQRSEQELNDILGSIPTSKGMVVSGQKIIDRGEIVDEYTARVLDSFEKEKSRRAVSDSAIRYTLLGHILYVSILILLFTLYIRLFRNDYFEKPRSLTMLYSLIAFFSVLVSLIMRHNVFSVYIIPFCIVPIFVRVFMDSRTAFITHVTTILISAMAVTYQYEFIIIQLVAGMVAEFSLREMSKRAQVLRTATLVCIASMTIYYALQLIQSDEEIKMDTDMYYHFIVNGVLTLLSYPLMYLMEKLFNFNSDVVLFELSNTNKGLLRKLSEVAPGTFQHSVTVANLAADIALKMGADNLLVHTGALYHDIGKMENPVFYTENQRGTNPHDGMTNVQSAQIIVSHVTNGIAIAEKVGLPQFIKDFILTHHGCGMAKYFYISEKNAHPDEEVDPEPFSYPGPNPFTREQAILMMTDATEAASRSLKEYTEESITELVNKIIDAQVAEGYFKECPITFRDIAIAKYVLIERLKGIYHTRISYPEMKPASETKSRSLISRKKKKK